MRCVVLLMLSMVFADAAGAAATFSVNDFGDAVDALPGDGICATALGACTLRAAIQESNTLAGADTIVLPAGTVRLSITGTEEDAAASGDLDVTDDLTISGVGADTSVVDAQAIDRVLDLQPAVNRRVRLERLTLRNGKLSQSCATCGAGLRVGRGVQLALSDVTIRQNVLTTFNGAAGVDNYGCVTGDHVRILDNIDPAPVGDGNARAGAVVTSGAATCFTLIDSEISGNRGDVAGAIYADDGAPITLRRTLVSGNTARVAGALLLNGGDEVLLENTTLSGNAGNPGAILNDGGSRLTLINSTVAFNGPSQGTAVVGGIQDVHGGFGLVFMTNTIVADNGPGFLSDDCSNAASVGGGNIIGNATNCTFSAQPGDQLDTDPGLLALADNAGFTRTHLVGSAAIDHGVASACPSLDQRAWPRPAGAACDVGAVDMQPERIFADGFESAGSRTK